MEKKTKRNRFVSVAELRVNRVISALESLSKCSNKRNYEYTDADVRKIFSAIDKKTKQTRSKFEGVTDRTDEFRLE